MYQCFETCKVSHQTHTHTHIYSNRIEISLLMCILALCLAPLYHCQSVHAVNEDLLMDNHRIQIYAPGLHILHLYKHINLCSWQEGYQISQGFQVVTVVILVMWQQQLVKKETLSRESSNFLTTKEIFIIWHPAVDQHFFPIKRYWR